MFPWPTVDGLLPLILKLLLTTGPVTSILSNPIASYLFLPYLTSLGIWGMTWLAPPWNTVYLASRSPTSLVVLLHWLLLLSLILLSLCTPAQTIYPSTWDQSRKFSPHLRLSPRWVHPIPWPSISITCLWFANVFSSRDSLSSFW